MANVSSNSSESDQCMIGLGYIVGLSLIDLITLLVGLPVIAKLLWVIFKSKKTKDILNCNLGLFFNLQYMISTVHLSVLFFVPQIQLNILRFIFVYVQIGGSMSLSFICLERYVAVIYPTSYPLLKKYRCREVCAATVWLFSVSAAALNVAFPDSPSRITENLLASLPFFVMVFMTAMMVRFSFTIARALKKSGPGRDELHPVKRRAFKTVRATASITLIFYIPVTVLQRSTFANENTHKCIILPLCLLLLSAASVVHPLIYLSTQGKLFICSKRGKKAR